MTKEERIALMTRGYPKGYIPEHDKLAAEVLDRLVKELDRQGFKWRDDNWPYHIVVRRSGGKRASLFCGGYSKAIDIQVLRKDGSPDNRFKEVRYLTPAGAVNYVSRRWKSE